MSIDIENLWSVALGCIRAELYAGWELVFRQPPTAVKFIIKCSLLAQKFKDAGQAPITQNPCYKPFCLTAMIIKSISLFGLVGTETLFSEIICR